MIVVSEFCNTLEFFNCSAESIKDLTDVCTRLHGDDSQLVLFVDPHKEGLVVVVENTSAVWPVTI
jgi:pyridoxine 5'-phosphate synthase PdxJ